MTVVLDEKSIWVDLKTLWRCFPAKAGLPVACTRLAAVDQSQARLARVAADDCHLRTYVFLLPVTIVWQHSGEPFDKLSACTVASSALPLSRCH